MNEDAMERFLNGETIELPPGVEVTPLYEKCPQCGCDLTQYFIDAENDKANTQDNKSNSSRHIVARMTRGNSIVPCKDARLKRVVDPFTNTNKEATKRNKCRWQGWKFWGQARPYKQENSSANNHNGFVPVVKRKLGERIFHWVFGRYR